MSDSEFFDDEIDIEGVHESTTVEIVGQAPIAHDIDRTHFSKKNYEDYFITFAIFLCHHHESRM